jgi:hypothetical protein
MALPRMDLIAIVGEYKNSAGETKKRFVKVGSLFNSDKGQSIKIDAVPVGFDGWLSVKEPYEDGQKPARQSSQPTRRGNDGDNDIPF